MRNLPTRAGGCLLVVVVLAVSAAPLAVAQPERRDAAPSANQDLVRLAQELQEEVEALRGWKFKHSVKTDVRSEQQLREFIETQLFEQQYGHGRFERTEAFLRMVGLIPPDCDLKKTILDALLNQIGGFYDHESKMFFMLQRAGIGYGPLLTRTLIVHELTHALDDQYVDLGKLITPNLDEDSAIAVGSIIEGSATILMMRYMLRAISSGEYNAEQLAEVQRQEIERSQAFLRAPPYFSTLMANYVCGMHFMSRGEPLMPGSGVFEKGIGDTMLAVCKNPPASSEQILHPYKYWDPKRRDGPVIVDERRVERVLRLDGLQVVHKNTVGELLCSLLASDENRELNIFSAALPTYWTNEAATGWGGDRFFLLAEGKDVESARKNLKGLKGVWITLWDATDDRDEFVEEYELERELPSRSVFTLGARGAVFLFGFDSSQRRALQRRFERTPPAFTKDGKPWSLGRK